MNTAVLFRKRGPAWEFVPSAIYHRNVHITRSGTVYGLMLDDASEYKQIWIGRWVPDANTWVTYEDRVGAIRIEFSNGGVYYFPRG